MQYIFCQNDEVIPAYNGELLMERYKAKDLCHEYNQLLPSDEENQQAIMKRLLGKTKGAFTIRLW
ncbi:MAG: hypothetical protein IIY42_05385 [Ruminococcus sp.]|nr:hypothetical protein [Ruminococcus sp.]